MHLRVLIDNNTCIDQYYLGEPGLSTYIEKENTSILNEEEINTNEVMV